MKKRWLLAVGLVLVLVVIGLAGCSPGSAALGELKAIDIGSQQEGIWVSGQGEVTAVPDIATLRLGIEAQEATVAEAQSKATEAMDNVMAALTANGIAENDIQTQYFSISKVTKWDVDKEEEVVIGYRVTNTVTAKIRYIDEAGTIIGAVAEAGGDLTRVDSISFSVDDPSEYYEVARQEAMADAKARAEQLAELAGVTLGKPTYISEGISYPVSPREVVVMEEAMAASAETPISPGEMEISLTIQVVYAIK
jgi:hypothetical protein